MRHVVAGLTALLLIPGGPLHGAPRPPELYARDHVVRSHYEFALRLYRQVNGRKGNLVLSPGAATAGLYALSRGTAGAAREQALAALCLSEKELLRHAQKNAHPFYAGETLTGEKLLGAAMHDMMRPWYHAPKRPFETSEGDCRFVNALWMEKGRTFQAGFEKFAQEGPRCQLNGLEGDGATDARRVNAWYSRQSGGQIKELFPAGQRPNEAGLLLSSAVRLTGEWGELARFAEKETREGEFHLDGKARIRVPMMRQLMYTTCYDGGTFRALHLGYKGDRLKLIVLLPNKRDGLAELEKGLTAEALRRCVEGPGLGDVEVFLPRFRVASSLDLGPALSRMGFRKETDFSALAGGKGKLGLSGLLQASALSAHEGGSGAGAGGPLKTRPTVPGARPAVFRADHPFLFVVVPEYAPHTVLLMGRVVNPKG